ncbi:GDSL-type esterase/lipase family protein [Thermomonospora umbrina]|uniref:Lysophospholipase L1-like esterase n=1 Tax=Thermomonospora umbrina TaxID=111806 RepID=A0A3D9SV07_9ACTN|nr:GDSL-type esterase/lipase family protein [Thermomonospora umbrina]REE96845.1 lysophospholipase L1-like esterase [Thermomonospora umbrina]
MRTPAALVAVLVGAATLLAGTSAPASARPADKGRWVGAWATAMQKPQAETFEGPTWAEQGFTGQSLRQVVRVTAGGTRLRIRLSNLYGTAPLRVTGATVGKAGAGASVRPGTMRVLRFDRSASAVIAPGRELVSDAARLVTTPGERLSATLYFAGSTGPATFHAFAKTPAYRATGDRRFDGSDAAFPAGERDTSGSSYFLTGVEVAGGSSRGAVVTFGDSITDGVSATSDATRYPDRLAERLAATGRPMAVLNTGIAGGKLLSETSCGGTSALERFSRDALDRPGTRAVVVLLGVNDILETRCDAFFNPCEAVEAPVRAARLIDAYRRLVRAAHSRGIKVVGVTVTPFRGFPGWCQDPREDTRAALNRWIRTGGELDGVADPERALLDPDPGQAGHLRDPEYNAGDGLHPNDAGLRVIADTVARSLRAVL